MSRVIGFEEVIAGRSLRIYEDRRWINPMADATPERPAGPFDLGWRRVSGGYLDLDARIWFFTNYYSVSPGMLSQTPGRGYFAVLRLYGPTVAAIDKSWKPGDIEKMP